MTHRLSEQTVLIVEDDRLFLGLIERLILQIDPDASVHSASSLKDATRMVRDTSFDIAFIDVGLPDGSGLELSRQLCDQFIALPIIIVTGEEGRDVWAEAADAGASAVLPKSALELDRLAGAVDFAREVTAGARIAMLTAVVAQQVDQTGPAPVEAMLHDLVDGVGFLDAGLQMWNAEEQTVLRARASAAGQLDRVGSERHVLSRSLHGWSLFLEVTAPPRRWGRIDASLVGLCDAVLASALLRDRQRRADASERRYRAVADATNDLIMTIDENGQIRAANAALRHLVGIEPVGLSIGALRDDYPALELAESLVLTVMATKEVAHTEDRAVIAADRPRWYSGFAIPAEPGSAGINVVLSETTSRVMTENELSTLALTDPLTGLANRRLAMDRLQHALDQVGRREGRIVVAALDIDYFKSINDLFGHAVGDMTLSALGQRIGRVLRSADTAARMGGDEFLIVAEGVPDDKSAEGFINRLHAELGNSIDTGERTIDVGVSIGYVVISDRGVAAEEALRRADAALYQAKNDGRNRWVLFETGQRTFGTAAEVSRELRRAFDEDRFFFRYQPIVRDGRMIAAEALVRLDHPDHGELLPHDFVDILIDSPLIAPIGMKLMSMAVSQLGNWVRHGVVGDDFRLHVNIAPQQLADAHFINHVVEQLAEADVDPRHLVIEITEQALTDLNRRSSALRRLADAGIGLYLDDFGTGSSSITHLRTPVLSGLKIDRTFVIGSRERPRDQEIVDGLISLGRSLGLDVVVEGVEVQEQLDTFIAGPPVAVQGFVYTEPILPTEIGPWAASLAATQTA